MTCLLHKSHQNNNKAIKNRYLESFTTRIINQRKYISHFEVARIFNLNPQRLAVLLDDFRSQPGQKDSVILEHFLRWMDDSAFYLLASHYDLPENEMQTVLAALGHYREVAV